MKNWRTTAVGVLSGVALIITQLIALFDSDPATVFSLEGVLAGFAAMGIGWFAKDAGVSGTAKSILLLIGASLLFAAPAMAEIDLGKGVSLSAGGLFGYPFAVDRSGDSLLLGTSRNNPYFEMGAALRYKDVTLSFQHTDHWKMSESNKIEVSANLFKTKMGVFGTTMFHKFDRMGSNKNEIVMGALYWGL